MNDNQSPGKYLHQDRVYWALVQGILCVFWVPAEQVERGLEPRGCAEIDYYRFTLPDISYCLERTDLLFD